MSERTAPVVGKVIDYRVDTVSPCALCGSRELVNYHDRPDAACGGCGALERHRALAGQLDTALTVRAGGRCLEIGPLNPFVFGGYLRAQGWRYEAVDKRTLRESSDPGGFDTFIDHDADLTDLRFAATARFELIVLQHVLEEISDYGAALDECSRVLEPGGRAVLEIPWTPESTTRHKGPDRYRNRWQFGDDLVGDLGARFAEVVPRTLSEGIYVGNFFLCTAR